VFDWRFLNLIEFKPVTIANLVDEGKQLGEGSLLRGSDVSPKRTDVDFSRIGRTRVCEILQCAAVVGSRSENPTQRHAVSCGAVVNVGCVDHVLDKLFGVQRKAVCPDWGDPLAFEESSSELGVALPLRVC
jgi:hypothetical protein